MREITCNFAPHSSQHVGSSASTFSGPKVCMLLSQEKWLVGCDPYSQNVAQTLADLTLFFDWQVLSKVSGITGDEDVQCTAFTILKKERGSGPVTSHRCIGDAGWFSNY